MRDYKKLAIWKKSHLLTKQVYKDIFPLMPAEERLALTSQLWRSSYSILLNIVKGCGKNSDKDLVHYLDNALGSTHEVEYTCYLIFDLGYIHENNYSQIDGSINELKAMLIAFIKYLRDEKRKLFFNPKSEIANNAGFFTFIL